MLRITKVTYLQYLAKYDEALKCVDKSLETFPNNAYALDAKGYILAVSGKSGNALEYYEKAIKTDLFCEEGYYHKGKAHEKLKQYKDALVCYNKVIELNPYCERAKQDKKRVKNLV